MRPFLFIIICFALIMFFAMSIDTYSQNFLAKNGISDTTGDIFYKTFGEFKNYLSDMSYLKADIYYHGGIYETHEHNEEKEENLHDNLEYKPSSNILLNIGQLTAVTEHRHLSGEEEKEIVPWIYYAVKLNPHNESAYSIGGFWLAVKLKNPDEAIKFLKEGIANNPDSWDIYATLGQVYLVNKKDYKNASFFLEKAEELGEEQKFDKFDRKRVCIFLAEAYKKAGNPDRSEKLRKSISID